MGEELVYKDILYGVDIADNNRMAVCDTEPFI
jgi:hypothetical protein